MMHAPARAWSVSAHVYPYHCDVMSVLYRMVYVRSAGVLCVVFEKLLDLSRLSCNWQPV